MIAQCFWLSGLFSLLVLGRPEKPAPGDEYLSQLSCWGRRGSWSSQWDCLGCCLILQASTWAAEGKRVLAELEQEHPGVVLQRLQMHWTKHPDLPPAHFRKMWALATTLDSEAIRQECRLAWAQCQDTWLALDQKLEAVLKLPRSENTASLFVHRGPTVPPLRKAFSLDRNLGQNPCKAAHCPPVSATSKAQPGPTPAMPLPGSAELRSPNRCWKKAGQGLRAGTGQGPGG